MSRSRWLLFGLVVSVALGGLAITMGRPHRVLYRGGPILTMDAQNRVVEALLIEGPRIVAAGTEAELRRVAGGAEVRDLRGKALLPGFIDAHSHFPGAGLDEVMVDLASPPLGDVIEILQLQARLRARVSEHGKGEWLVGQRYDETLLREKRHPTRKELDEVSIEHPVLIVHISGHRAVANSLGLQKLGIHQRTPDPVGGKIGRDGNGEPDGSLEETASEAALKRLAGPSLLQTLRITRRASSLYAAQGVTTVQSGLTLPNHRSGLAWLVRLKLIPQRMVMWQAEEAVEQDERQGQPFRSTSPERLAIGAVKLLADGSIQGYTGYLSTPYFVPPGTDASYRGSPRWSKEVLTSRIKHWHTSGRQLAVHANGDAAIEDVLDAFAAAQAESPSNDPRFVLVHAQMARPDQLDRMKLLGVIPSFFVLHTYYWGDRHREIFLGAERAARISPTRDANERGLRFTLHADTPVTPMEPLRMVWSAVNRKTTTGILLGPEQRISPMQALRAITITAAYQHFQEQTLGSLEPGKFADLVILDRSPLLDPEHIDRIRVVETWVAGKRIYAAE